MTNDLSAHHGPVSAFCHQPQTPAEWEQYALSQEQIDHFQRFGYVKGIRILSEPQCDLLLDELQRLTDPKDPGNGLFYYFKSNEAEDPDKTLFHALGAWRITPGFHDLLWAPAFTHGGLASCWAAPCGSGTISCSASRPGTAAWWRGIRIIRTGPAPSRWPISPAGSAWTTARATTAA